MQMDSLQQKITHREIDILSLDVFDTAIVRPFGIPQDLYFLLDKKYEEAGETSSLSMHRIRVMAERGAREKLAAERQKDRVTSAGDGESVRIPARDLKLPQIYDYMHAYMGIGRDVCDALMEEEIRLELQFCRPRKRVKALYDAAKRQGIKTVFVSDMYLEEKTIRKMLVKCGYDAEDEIFVSSESGYCKYTGELFPYVIAQTNANPARMLHIGDNERSDVDMAKKAGMQAYPVPSAAQAFAAHTASLVKNGAPALAAESDWALTLGVRAMRHLSAIRYFDDPFRPFLAGSELNADPALIGAYPLAMYLLGICHALEQQVKANGYRRVLFVARDGFLPKKAFDRYAKAIGLAVETEYLYASRKAVMPLMMRTPEDFRERSEKAEAFTPEKMLALYAFCVPDEEARVAAFWERVREAGIPRDAHFRDAYTFHRFMNLFLDHLYDRETHDRVNDRIRRYFSQVKEDDLVYDMGYQGTIQDAMAYAAGRRVNVCMVNTDPWKYAMFERRDEVRFDAVFGSFTPNTGVIREYLLSDRGPSCVGYEEKDGGIVPVFEEHGTLASPHPVDCAQEAALAVVEDYLSTFAGFHAYLPVKAAEAMLPFECFLSMSKSIDRLAFAGHTFEDSYNFAKDAMDVKRFWDREAFRLKLREDETLSLRCILMNENDGRPLAVWGTGKIAGRWMDHADGEGVDVFIDNDPGKAGASFRGRKILAGRDPALWKDCFILIATAAWKDVASQLEAQGMKRERDYRVYFEV